MIEHTSNEILTFCIHVGYDISTAADLRFHYSMAKCQYFIIRVAFHSVVLRIATPAGNPVACALQEIPLPGLCRKSHCLGPAGNPIAWALQEISLPRACRKSHCLGLARVMAKVAILVSSSSRFTKKCFARQTFCFMLSQTNHVKLFDFQ